MASIDNSSASTNRKAYTANISLAFDYDGGRVDIESERISYIMVNSDYEADVLPIIYVSLAVTSDLYTNIIKYKDSAKFYLNIKTANKFSKASINKNNLSGSFSYIPSTTNPNYTENLDENGMDSYKRIMLGLVSIELTNSLRKSFNFIAEDIDQNTLVAIALEGLNPIVEKLKYNNHYDTYIVPPMTSRFKFLEYIFNHPFYDTKFRFFMDFQNTYLVSKSGNAIASDSEINDVIVDIREVTVDEAYYDGISVKNGAYYIYVNSADSNVSVNIGTEKIANQIVAIDDEIETQILSLNINSNDDSSDKKVFIRTKSAAIYKNDLETSSINVEFTKQNVDGSIFTPDRCFMVNNYGEYSKYNGRYLLMYKKEFYRCVGGEFILSTVVGLRKVNDIEHKSATTDSKTTSKTTSSSAIRKSSANYDNNNISASGNR